MLNMYNKKTSKSVQLSTFNQDKKTKVVNISPKETKTIMKFEGEGVINRIWLTFPGWFWQHWNRKAKIDSSVLKTTIIKIYWDGFDYPSVVSPIGDFFGNGHQEFTPYDSIMLSMTSGGFCCFFQMPFHKSFRIEIENMHNEIPVDLFMNINLLEQEILEDARYFHAMFSTGYHDAGEDLELFSTKGSGHYVGTCLSMQSKEYNDLSFLEAPEYIWIDGEEKASIVGTGLEDYFGGGWYFRDGCFSSLYHGVPLKDSLRSMISMYRFHCSDTYIFNKSMKFVFRNPMPLKHLKPYWHSSCVYWYQLPLKPLKNKLPDKKALLDCYRTRDIDHISIP